MSVLSKLVGRVAPMVAALSPEPVSRTLATAKVQSDQRKAYREQLIERNKQMQYGEFGQPLPNLPSAQVGRQGTQSSNFFGGVTDFFSGIGDTISDVGSGLTNIFDTFGTAKRSFNRIGSNPQPAVDRISTVPRESEGTSTAFIGGVPGVVNAATRFLKTPLGGAIFGTGAGTAISMMTPDGKKMRITRKMKSQVRSVFNMTGGNFQATADFFNLDVNQVMFILVKRFRNDGPVVTKAALRKTKTTIRRLKNMCDMYEDLRPARRRTPMKRATTTRITNVK